MRVFTLVVENQDLDVTVYVFDGSIEVAQAFSSLGLAHALEKVGLRLAEILGTSA